MSSTVTLIRTTSKDVENFFNSWGGDVPHHRLVEFLEQKCSFGTEVLVGIEPLTAEFLSVGEGGVTSKDVVLIPQLSSSQNDARIREAISKL